MRTILGYLWEHQGENINEYSLAVDALGRSTDFDPKLDANVRVQIARLRQKLSQCYEGELKSFPLRLSIPRGTHELKWSYNPRSASLSSVIAELPPFQRIVLVSVVAFAVVVLSFNVLLLWHNRTSKTLLRVVPSPLPQLWKSFLVDGKRPLIVVPSVTAFRWPNNNILVRDTKISRLEDWSTSPFVSELAKRWGPPTVHQEYVLGIELEAALKLREYLEEMGERPEMIESRYLPADSGNTRNRIFLGAAHLYPPGDPVRQALTKTNFSISNEPTIVTNRNPRPGELREYRVLSYSQEHRVIPELVILLPRTIKGGGRTPPDGPRTQCFSVLITITRWPGTGRSSLLFLK